MDVIRQVLGGGGDGGGSGDEEEEEALLAHEGDSSSSSTEVESEEEKECSDAGNKTSFDVSLPAQHLYLGQLEEEGRAAMEDEEATPTLPLLCLPERVLFPGETLPMHIYSPHAIQVLRNAATQRKPVAFITDLREEIQLLHPRRPSKKELSQVGTTAEVLALRDEEEETQYWGPCLVVKFLGRQRFRLLEVIRRVNGQMEGRVVILPEQLLPPRPLELFSCPAHVYSGCLASQQVARTVEASAHSRQLALDYNHQLQRPTISSSLCQVPTWVFSLYDLEHLRNQIIREQMMLMSVAEGVTSDTLPEDIVSLSYWLSRRLPISDTEKLQLLSLHCPTLRLLKGLQILQELTDLCCDDCGALITKKAHIFSMSVDGPVASYVNPGGFIHDTLTARQAENVTKQGRATTEHSWFPGYQWTILNCRRCGHHKGWFFEATKKDLKPTKFYGLRRECLKHKSSKDVEEEGEESVAGPREHPCAPS